MDEYRIASDSPILRGSVDGIQLVMGAEYVALTEDQAARLEATGIKLDIDTEEEEQE